MRRAPLSMAACALLVALLPGAPRAGGARAPALPGLSAPARIVTDRWGISHLEAANAGDLYELWGYVTARDRLWQLVEQRAAARGELHGWLGNDVLRADGGAQLFRLRERAAAIWAREARDPALREALERYSAGINARLAECRSGVAPWPGELALLRAEPEDWKPEDSVLLLLGLGTTLDLGFGDLADDRQIREHGAAWYANRRRFEGRLPYATIPAAAPGAVGDAAPRAAGARALPASAARDAEAALAWAPPRAEDGSDRASNVMVVGPRRAAAGRPLLANDPHLALTAPGAFHVVHVYVPGYVDAAGAAVPGLPTIVSGRNRRCAWGVTALSAKVIDCYADTLSADGRRVKGPAGWTDVVTKPFALTYRFLGVPLPALGQVRRYGPHGPILVWDPKHRLAVGARWSALEDERITLREMVGVERSHDAAEVARRFRTLVTPTINLAVADVDGDCRYQATGLVPRRSAAPAPGVQPGDGRHEWAGFLAPEAMPAWRVPADGFAVNGNNRPVANADDPDWTGYDWAQDRALRMAQRLAGDRSITLADLMSVQNDVWSRAAARQVPALLAAAARSPRASARARAAMGTLRAWDGMARRDRVAPTLARSWWDAYVRRGRFEGVPGLALAVLTGEAHDAVVAPGGARETPAAAAAAALETALDTLTAKLGPGMERWTWARAHRAHFRSAAAPAGGARFEPAPVPADGDGSTVCVGPSQAPWNFEFGHGPTYREVIDLADSTVAWVAIPPWNSAATAARDGAMLARWAAHGYVPLHLDRAGIARVAASVTEFAPAR